jgi:hypothetical protein
MKSSPTRVAVVAGALLLAGAAFGAAAGAIGIVVAGRITEGSLPPMEIVSLAMAVGAAIGAPLLPATAFLLLRRVPLGLSFVGTTLGTVAGAVAGWLGGRAINPFLWPVIGAIAGFFAAVAVLRLRYPARAEAARRVSVA